MANLDDVQKQYEQRLTGLIGELTGGGAEADLALVRALIHRAVHVASERKTVQFCALATFLGEMIGHAHHLQHGGEPASAAHHDVVH